MIMKEIGNLAIVAAKDKYCLLQIYDEEVTLHVGEGPDRKIFFCNVWDDESIKHLIAHVNFRMEVPQSEKIRCVR